jgi:hypothetical protein
MNITRIKKQLREAKKLWDSGLQSRDIKGIPGFLPGVDRGLREALAIIEAYHRQDLAKTRADRRPLSRWTATTLYKACQLAYKRLQQSDRPGAMRVLQRALDQIESRN